MLTQCFECGAMPLSDYRRDDGAVLCGPCWTAGAAGRKRNAMIIVNLTPHAVTIQWWDTPRTESRWTIPASGAVARCTVTSELLGNVYFESAENCSIGVVPVTTSRLGAVEGLPAESDGTAYIVSRIVAEACPERADLYFPGEAIRDERGQIVGYRGLCQIGGAS